MQQLNNWESKTTDFNYKSESDVLASQADLIQGLIAD